MSKSVVVRLICLGFVALAASPVAAQDVQSWPTDDPNSASSPTYTYSQPTYSSSVTPKSEPLAIIHQRAQERAAQRQLRLASMAWYGMSNSRPTASTTPFAGIYSPVWQMPGSRPFAWYATNWPTWPVYVR